MILRLGGHAEPTEAGGSASLCIEAHPRAKSTLGDPEPWSTIARSNVNFWDIEAILGTHLGANRVQ
jgi:hypothetical protein